MREGRLLEYSFIVVLGSGRPAGVEDDPVVSQQLHDSGLELISLCPEGLVLLGRESIEPGSETDQHNIDGVLRLAKEGLRQLQITVDRLRWLLNLSFT